MGKKTIIAVTALALLGLGGGAYLELGGKAPAGAGEAAAEGEGSGPRGGMLLRQGDLTLELLVPEDGSPLKAWVERGGKALAPQEVVLGADVERCYTAGLLHRLGDLALLRTLQDWCDGGGALDEARLDELLGRFGASFGSALRARWRLPLELRRLIAAAYQFGGVLSREELILSLATQAASLPEDDAEQLAESKAARMLGLDGERLAKLLQP